MKLRLSHLLFVVVLAVAMSVSACSSGLTQSDGTLRQADPPTAFPGSTSNVVVQSLPDTTASSRPETKTTTMSTVDKPTVTAATTTIDGVSELVGRDWIVTGGTATDGRNPRDFKNHLLFSRLADGEGHLSLRGCDTGTFPVAFEAGQRISVGKSTHLETCTNPFDVGQAIPNVLERPLEWSVVGTELTLTPAGDSAPSLTLTAND